MLLKPQVPAFGGEKANPLCFSGGWCFLYALSSAVVGSLPTDLGSGCGRTSFAAELTAQLSALLLTWQQLLWVATDFCSGVSWWLGGVADVPTLLTAQVGGWVLSPCTVSGAYSVLLQGFGWRLSVTLRYCRVCSCLFPLP